MVLRLGFAGLMRYIAVLAAMSALPGCLIVPTPEVSEIRNSRLEFIEPGQTTRSVLESQLLSDDVFEARVLGPYTIYAEYRRAPFSVVAEGATVQGDVDDYLVVEYDRYDRVVRFDRLRREGACTSYGLCVRGGTEQSADSLVVFAPTHEDEALKRFEAQGGSCSVYAYVDGGFSCNGTVDVANIYPGAPSSLLTRARVDGYFHWDMPVDGNAPTFGRLVAERRGQTLADYRFDCSDGETLIVGLELKRCAIGVPRATFSPRSLTEGQKEISERRLIMERLSISSASESGNLPPSRR
jgi:hypothetical protein